MNEFKLLSTGFVPILATAIYVWRISSDTAPYWQAIAAIIKRFSQEEDHKKCNNWAGNFLQKFCKKEPPTGI